MFRLSRHKQSVFTGTPVARNDRIALNYFDEANSKPLNLTAKRVFFLKIDRCLFTRKQGNSQDQMFVIKAVVTLKSVMRPAVCPTAEQNIQVDRSYYLLTYLLHAAESFFES